MKSLPDKPSELLRLAVHDLELCERDPRYVVNMNSWQASKCHVCLAGSVLAKTCKFSMRESFLPVVDKNWRVFRALDKFRCGLTTLALARLGIINESSSVWEEDVPIYEKNPSDFKHTMLAIADALEVQGL